MLSNNTTLDSSKIPSLTLRSHLDNLINASKQGNVTSALLWLGQINGLSAKEDGSTIGTGIQPLTLNSVRYIFRPNMSKSDDNTTNNLNEVKQHSPLYYAALNGHYNLVEYYLSLYLIYAAKITFNTMHTSQSFRSWFIQVNSSNSKKKKKAYHKKKKKDEEMSSSSSSFFGLADYDECAIQSKNRQTKNVLIGKKINIAYAMSIVEKASFSCVPYEALIKPRLKTIYVKMKTVTEKKRKKWLMRPAINNDEKYNCDDGSFSNNNYKYQDDNEAKNEFLSIHSDNHSMSASESGISHIEDDYEIVEHPLLSIELIDTEKDMLAVEVSLQEEKCDIERSYDDESTTMSFQSFITRATWLPKSLKDAFLCQQKVEPEVESENLVKSIASVREQKKTNQDAKIVIDKNLESNNIVGDTPTHTKANKREISSKEEITTRKGKKKFRMVKGLKKSNTHSVPKKIDSIQARRNVFSIKSKGNK
jgi:hypothetical protein